MAGSVLRADGLIVDDDGKSPYMQVRGRCPMGCSFNGGMPLRLEADKHAKGLFSIVCADPACPQPKGAQRLLDDATTAHVVRLGQFSFTVKHPLRERLDDRLFECNLHLLLAEGERPDLTPGHYRVFTDEHGAPTSWQWMYDAHA